MTLSLRNVILVVGIIAMLFSVLLFSGKIPSPWTKKDSAKGEVVLWGTFPEQLVYDILGDFNPQVKNYRVSYREIREEDFEQKLLEALANQSGPDLILAPYQIILAQEERLYPFPLASIPEKMFKDSYVDGANVLFSQNGALALPISIEPMVLFYNRTLFSKKGIVNLPVYWDEMLTFVPALTELNNKGQFVTTGLALGTQTVPYVKDILMGMVMQLGQSPVIRQFSAVGTPFTIVSANEPTTQGGINPLASAVRFFVQFADPNQQVYSWNQYAGDAKDRFLSEQLAMYLGYSSELGVMRAQNPRAEIEMTTFPQTRGYNTFVTPMRMNAIATLRTSRNLVTALTVQSQFASTGVIERFALGIGALPPLRSYASIVGLDPILARSMLVARGWYDSSYRQSLALVTTMIADILSNRQGVTDAVDIFTGRLSDLYE